VQIRSSESGYGFRPANRHVITDRKAHHSSICEVHAQKAVQIEMSRCAVEMKAGL
jgi:hypothetical protein